MELQTEKHNCCGCTACMNICPKKCIQMKEDEEGFLYPHINVDECIQCNMCKDVCPMQNTIFEDKNKHPEAYVYQLSNNDILKNSASGGFFYELGKFIIKMNGYVCGAVYDENFNVIHHITNDIDELNKFSGSKYVQSNLNTIFLNIKRLLDSNKIVCFSGTVCQTNGLKKYLNKNYKNLITVDLVCAGVPSPKLWNKYKEYQQGKYNSRIIAINFRNKTYGYSNSTMKIEFINGQIYSKSARIDSMMNFFVNGFVKRPSCYSCPFKGVQRNSDFTIFDAWCAEKILNIKNDNKGWTAVLVHNEFAKEILSSLDDRIRLEKVNLEKIVETDGKMIYKQPLYPNERDTFYKDLNEFGFEFCAKKYMKITRKDRILESIKPVLFSIGIISYFKDIKNKMKKGDK